MKQTDRPKRKVNAPKRFICENIKNKNTIINKLTCYRCKVDITLNKIKYFEHNNNIYCNLCYIDIINIPNIIPNNIPNIPKLNIIIMNKSKSNPNLIDINNKTNKTNNVKTSVNNISIKKNANDDNEDSDDEDSDDDLHNDVDNISEFDTVDSNW